MERRNKMRKFVHMLIGICMMIGMTSLSAAHGREQTIPVDKINAEKKMKNLLIVFIQASL